MIAAISSSWLPTRTAYVSSKIAIDPIGVLWPSPFFARKRDRTKNLTSVTTGRCTACRSPNGLPRTAIAKKRSRPRHPVATEFYLGGRIAGMIFFRILARLVVGESLVAEFPRTCTIKPSWPSRNNEFSHEKWLDLSIVM